MRGDTEPNSYSPSDDSLRPLRQEDTAEFVLGEDTRNAVFDSGRRVVGVDIGAATHCGNVREHNEDHFIVARRISVRTIVATNLPPDEIVEDDDGAHVFAVADGLGGHSFGEIASRLAIRSRYPSSRRETSWLLEVLDHPLDQMTEWFSRGAQGLHEELINQASIDSSSRGMATTLTAAFVVGRDVLVAHIGDSRAYLLRDNESIRLTRDHTLAQDLARSGLRSANLHSVRHVLTNCLGGDDGRVRIDFERFRIEDGDELLLCTDGLSDVVTDEEFPKLAAGHSAAQEHCDGLVNLALERGGRDNITVLAARFRVS